MFMYDFYDPAPEYSSAVGVLCCEQAETHAFGDSAAPECSGEANFVKSIYASSKQ